MATIVNNNLTADEDKLRVINPLLYVPDPDSAGPLGLAYLYFGEPSKDPELAENRKRVYALQEDGSAVPISQPIRTTVGGVPEYNGSPVGLAISGNYSYKALSSASEQKYYFPNVENATNIQVGNFGIIEDIVTLAENQTVVTFPNVDLSLSTVDVNDSAIDSRSLYIDIDYAITDGSEGIITLSTSYPAGTLIRARQNVSTAQEDELVGIKTMYSAQTTAEAKAINFTLGDTCTIVGDSTSNDGLAGDRYEVVANGTGANDGVNFIALDNTLQLRLISGRYKLKAYTETLGQAEVLSGALSVDLNNGTVQEVTLTENVSSINFGNVNTQGVTTVQLTFKQDAVGGHSVSFTGFISAGAVAPVITPTALAEDILVFTSKDGVTWYLFASGQDFGVIV